MFTVTLGSLGGVSQSLANSVLATAQAAAAYWERYIDTGPSSIDVRIDIVSLGGSTLAQAGTDYYFAFSSGGFDYYDPATIIEMTTGVDENGSDPDIPIEVDLTTLTSGGFNFGPFVDNYSVGGGGQNRIDLWTVLVHEIAHGLGLLSFLDEGGSDRTSFDRYVTLDAGVYFFDGPDPGFGPIRLDSSIAHIANITSSVLNASIGPATVKYLTELDVSIFGDLGAALRRPTSGDDELSSFSTPTANSTVLGLAGNDTIKGLIGFDWLYGGEGDDVLYGSLGNDQLYGDLGNDTLRGDPGSDLLDGSGGHDVADYRASPAAIDVDFVHPLAVSGGDATGDQLYNIDEVWGSSFNDTLRGIGVEETLRGGGGNDAIYGGAANDLLDGGDGSDLIRGGDGADALDGGAGADTLDYSDAGEKVVVRLWNLTASGGTAAGDVIAGFEHVLGGSAGDAIVGSDGVSNLIMGGGGNDAIQGLSGYDTLRGGAGADNLNGGAGVDTLDYSDAIGAVVVRLWNQTATGDIATGDVIAGFERVFGGAGNDAIVGSNDVANYLVGNAGADNMQGLSGNDILFGGVGADTLSGGPGADRFDFIGASGVDRITDFTAGAGVGDVLRLVGFGAAYDSFAEIIAVSTQAGGNVVVNLGSAVITLIGVSKSSLVADDFMFT